MLIKFKAVYLSKILIYVIVGGVIFSALLFMTLPLDTLYIYGLCMLCIMPAMIYAFYLNRNELLTMKGGLSEVEFSFINKSIFKRKDMKLSKQEIDSQNEGNIIRLLHNNQVFAVVRKAAVKEEEWKEICTFFEGK